MLETGPELLRAAELSPPDAVLIDIEIGGGLTASELLFALWESEATRRLPVLLLGSSQHVSIGDLLAVAAEFTGVDVCPATDKAGLELRIRWFAALCRSLAEIDRLESRVQELMTTDMTTGLYNHQEILRILGSQCRIADRYGRDLSVICADIDYLGLLNEKHGYERGDDALRAFASAAKKSSRAADIVGRLAGGGFLLILPETSLEGARSLAERIRSNFESEELIVALARSIPVTVSMACAAKTGPEDEHRFLARAAAALRRAKEAGRNRVVVAGAPSAVETQSG